MDAAVSADQGWRMQMVAEMNAAGMDDPATVIADGKLHRFGRNDSGWYVVYSGDHFTSWAFGDWRAGIKHKGHTKPGRKLSRKEWRAHKKLLREQRAQVQAERLAIQETAAIEAQKRWRSLKSRPADPSHPYLKAKRVEPCGARQDGDRLVLAMMSIHDGKIWSWREIGPDGFKHNQPGALQKGCYFRIGDPSDIFVICEGFATGATLAKVSWNKLPLFYARSMERPTILAAGDAGNLEEVARGVRQIMRDAVIIIAADDDWLTKPRNTGVIAAEKAAKAVGGILVKPWFPSGRPQWATDFNDQYKLCGIDQVYDTFNLELIQHEEIKAAQREAAAAAFGENDEETEDLPPVEFPSSEKTVQFSEDALSLALADRHVDEWRHVQKWGWMHFRGGRWTLDESNRTLTYTRKVCRIAAIEADDKKLAAASTVAAVERLTRYDERFAMATDEWDRDPWLLNTPSGTVDLKTGRMRAHRRDDYVTKVTAVSPANTGCPLFMEFMQKITNNDSELIAFHQRSLGYAMTGVTREHALLFWYGDGSNGKSVLLNTIVGILGEYHTAAAMETFVETHGDRHPTELASLRGARIVTAVETEQGRNWAEAKIKALTGGDPISARFMRQDPFTFTPQFKLIVVGNHKPSLRSVDEAIRRRLHLAPFIVKIPKGEQDKDLTDKLKGEWPGILNWLIDGCLEWQQMGLAPPVAVAEATEEYLASQDSIAIWIEDRCIVDATAWTNVTELFASYSGWAQKAGERIGSQKQFKDALGKTRLVSFSRTKKGSGYTGLKINPMRPADSTIDDAELPE